MKTQLTLVLLSLVACSQVAAEDNYLQTLFGSLFQDGAAESTYDASLATSSHTKTHFQDFSDLQDSRVEDYQEYLHEIEEKENYVISGRLGRHRGRELKGGGKKKKGDGPKAPAEPKARRYRELKGGGKKKKGDGPKAPAEPKARRYRELKGGGKKKKGDGPKAPAEPKARRYRELKGGGKKKKGDGPKAPAEPKAPKDRR